VVVGALAVAVGQAETKEPPNPRRRGAAGAITGHRDNFSDPQQQEERREGDVM